jgi:hypothetical protein
MRTAAEQAARDKRAKTLRYYRAMARQRTSISDILMQAFGVKK